jgi:ketosteroid isomerase-like protein
MRQRYYILLLAAAMLLSVPLAPAQAKAPQAISTVSVVDRLLVDFAAQNLPSIEGYVADDAVMITQLPMSEPVRLAGKTAIIGYFRTVFDLYDVITISDVIKTRGADGNTIVVEAKGTYKTPQGDAHSVGYVWIVEARRGMLVSSRNYTFPLPAR